METQSIKDGSSDFYDSEVVRKFELTEEIISKAQEIINSDRDTITEFWKDKYVKESVKNWDKFYKRNNINFFLDRHWIDKEFKELISNSTNVSDDLNPKILIEFGCGVGNSLIPLLQISKDLHCIGFDCSSRAISLFEERWNKILANFESNKKDSKMCPFKCLKDSDKPCNRFRGFVFDIVHSDIPAYICPESFADFGLLIFVLSAIHPKHHQDVVTRCSKSLKSGATLLFRDYGRYDMAQLRFAKSSKSKITDNFYVRYDGTFAYYFTIEEVEDLFVNAGFKVISNHYCLREVVNRKTKVTMQRVWIQAKFTKI
ncbi:Methyltransferase-like protein [Cryptosporidium meleagridis]